MEVVPRRKVNLSPTWQLQSLWQFSFRGFRVKNLGFGDYEPVQKMRCLMELDRFIFVKSMLMFRGVPWICFHWELGF